MCKSYSENIFYFSSLYPYQCTCCESRQIIRYGSYGRYAVMIAEDGSLDTMRLKVQMPGNCLKSSEEENRKRLNKAPSCMERILLAVKEREVNYSSDKSFPATDYVTGSYFYGEHSLKRLTLMKNFTVTKECTGCGVCVSVCPLNNIKITNQKAVHGHDCAACYACLHWCPQNATLLNVPTLKHRAQYHHPEIMLKEIAIQKSNI